MNLSDALVKELLNGNLLHTELERCLARDLLQARKDLRERELCAFDDCDQHADVHYCSGHQRAELAISAELARRGRVDP